MRDRITGGLVLAGLLTCYSVGGAQQAQKDSSLEREVRAALKAATSLLAKLQALDPTSTAYQIALVEARAEVRLAQVLLKHHPATLDAASKRQLQQLSDQLQNWEKDRQLLERLEQIRLEARAERDPARNAEAQARRQAQQALAAEAAARQEAEKALSVAKKEAEQAAYAAHLRAAQQEWAAKEKAKAEVKPLPAALQQAKEKLLNQFALKRAELLAQLKHLDAEQQKVLGELERQALLVQILERLERIERRLGRLEQNQPDAPHRPKK